MMETIDSYAPRIVANSELVKSEDSDFKTGDIPKTLKLIGNNNEDINNESAEIIKGSHESSEEEASEGNESATETGNNLLHKKRKNSESSRRRSKRRRKENTLPKPTKLQEEKQHTTPKQKLGVQPIKHKKKQIFIYGNYSRYYGYRNLESFHDPRMDIFNKNKDLFRGKDILDIGCNSGLLTMELAKDFEVKFIHGLDIDSHLINKANKYIRRTRKSFTRDDNTGFPFNINFTQGNYVLKDEVLLEIEEPKFDLILCLSVTKWIHLNFGDVGLKLAFKRMFLQLRVGGKLILEAQPWTGYKRRKKLTPKIYENYKTIKFQPKDFDAYLLGSEVGFQEMYILGIPDHSSKGFQRPIQVFVKKEINSDSK